MHREYAERARSSCFHTGIAAPRDRVGISPIVVFVLIGKYEMVVRPQAFRYAHKRMLDYCGQVCEQGLLNVSGAVRVKGRMDAESFVGTLRRMLRLCELVRRSGLPQQPLRQPIRLFVSQVGAVTVLRNRRSTSTA
jgi:hypothetical protein